MADQLTPSSNLAHIATRWSAVHDPDRFVLRYAPAIRGYLLVLLGDPHDADDVLQDFMLKVAQRGWERVNPDGGKFRHYLIASVRNAAISAVRKKARTDRAAEELIESLPDHRATEDCAAEWRQCVLDGAWRRLHEHQTAHPRGLCHAVLRARADDPDADAPELAKRLSAVVGRAITPDAFRQQLARSRKLFAGFLVDEIADTLDDASPTAVEEELSELGLMELVRDYLKG